MLTKGVHEGRISLQRLVQVSCENPAKIYGLYPQKGAIRLGADADLVVVDPEETWTYSFKTSYIKAKTQHGPYEGRTFRGRVKETLVRGQTVYVDHDIRQAPGFGRFVAPAGTAR
jgi:allantoinase